MALSARQQACLAAVMDWANRGGYPPYRTPKTLEALRRVGLVTPVAQPFAYHPVRYFPTEAGRKAIGAA